MHKFILAMNRSGLIPLECQRLADTSQYSTNELHNRFQDPARRLPNRFLAGRHSRSTPAAELADEICHCPTLGLEAVPSSSPVQEDKPASPHGSVTTVTR